MKSTTSNLITVAFEGSQNEDDHQKEVACSSKITAN